MSTQVLPKSFFLIGISPNPSSWEKIKQYLDLYSYQNKKVGLDISETQLKKIESLPDPTHMDYIGNPKLALAREIINYAKKQKLNIIPLKTPRANNRRVSEENEWIHSRTIKEKDNQVSEYLIESGMRMRVKKHEPCIVIVQASRMGAFKGMPHKTIIDERGFLEKHFKNTIEKMRQRQILRRARNIRKIRKKQPTILKRH